MGFALDIRQAATDAHPDDLNAAAIWATEFSMTATLIVPAHSHRQPMPSAQSAPSAESMEAKATREVSVGNMEIAVLNDLK